MTKSVVSPRTLFVRTRVTSNANTLRLGARSHGHVLGAPANRVKGRRRPRTIAGDFCSFSPETSVAIGELKPGAYVLAYDEATGQLGFYPVTAVYSHTDPLLVHLTVDGEVIETTPEHPFSTAEGEWMTAAELQPGQQVRNAAGAMGWWKLCNS